MNKNIFNYTKQFTYDGSTTLYKIKPLSHYIYLELRNISIKASNTGTIEWGFERGGSFYAVAKYDVTVANSITSYFVDIPFGYNETITVKVTGFANGTVFDVVINGYIYTFTRED